MLKATNLIKDNELKQETFKTVSLPIHEVEENSVIVNLNGWRMRIYFTDEYKNEFTPGRDILAKYSGDINDPTTVIFQKMV